MKNNVYTAGFIFNKMFALREEVREYQRAMESVQDECGSDSKPFKLMEKMYKEKYEEAMEFEHTEFDIVDKDKCGEFDF
jgi:hypothetical protein